MAGPTDARRSRRFPLPCLLGSALAASLALACGSSPSGPSALPTPAATPTPPPRVALISVDGLRPDGLTATNAPSIVALAARGAYSLVAQTAFPSTTLPSHASMLTGVEPSAHGITFDEFRDGFQLGSPTVLALAHAAGKRTLMVVGKDKMRQLSTGRGADVYLCATRGDVDVVNETIARLPLGFDLLFVHLAQVDLVGHTSGWMSPEYVTQLKQTDDALGRLLAQLPPQTTVLLTADHGGQLRNHGSRDAIDMTIPWIIAGPRVIRRGVLARKVRTEDTAATVLSLLGVALPANLAGKPVSEAFEEQ